MSKEPEWGYNKDGSVRKFGDLTKEEWREVMRNAGAKLQAEFDAPNSPFKRACKALLEGPDVPKTKQ